MFPIMRRVALAVTIASLAACGGGDSATSPTPTPTPNPNPQPAPVATVALTPDSSSVFTGRTRELVATVRDSAGNTLNGRTITFASSAPEVAIVSVTGAVTGVNTGRAVISATAEGKTAQAVVTVQPVPVSTVTITPDSVNALLGTSVTLTAQTKDDAGAMLTGRVVRWSSSAPNIVDVDSITGVAKAMRGGIAIITARSEGKSAGVRMVVRVPVATVTVQTALDTLEAYDALQMNAVLRDANQEILTDRIVRWTVSNTSLARVDSVTGVLTGLNRGTVTVTATSEGKTGSASRVVVIKYRSLVTGAQHSCDIASGGFVWCWGKNGGEGRVGQVDLDAESFFSQPVRVPNTGPAAIRAKKLASFGRHTCALDVNGKAWCWGGNGWGTLGVPAISQSNTPVAVAGGLQFKDIAVGADHSCAITMAGTMYCWGHNDWRQFASNALAMSETPMPAGTALQFKALTAGSSFTCGITVSDDALCWGYSGWGNLGDGTVISYGNTFSATPLAVSGGRSWRQVGAGQIHACGLTTAGLGFCWGNNGGKLGNGATTESSTPVALTGVPTLSALAVGANHNCAIATTADVWCWGFNGNGQAGQPASVAVVRPARVANIKAAEVAASGIATGSAAHSCAVSLDRLTVWCWGRNDYGQLGDGNTSGATVATPTPVIVLGQRPLQ